MFCPKCGQPQVSNEVRFCVRCGLQLDNVKSLITNEVMFVQREAYNQPVPTWKKPGVKTSAKLIFLSIILAPIFFSLAIINENPGPLIVPFTLFLLGILWMIYSLVFGESPMSRKANQNLINPANTQAYLPQPQPQKTLHAQPINTAEMIKPPSVTENTTKLFEQK